MTELEFREKFTERFNLTPETVIPRYVLEAAENIPIEIKDFPTKDHFLLAQKRALFFIRYAHSASGRSCSKHSTIESCKNCYYGFVLPFET